MDMVPFTYCRAGKFRNAAWLTIMAVACTRLGKEIFVSPLLFD